MAKATHILAGAYSNHYQAIEKQHVEHLKQLAENESLDAIARSKKLTLETNKRRKAQAEKRKQEADKEEKRNTSPARALDEALKIVRRSSSATRHNSARARSPRRTHSRENSDPLNRPYVNKYAVNNRPASPSSPKGRDPNKLHNNSLKNLNNSKSLFEQQLEQQQQFLIEQHQRALQEFNVEINSDREVLPADQQYEQSNGLERSESLSSVDSLEGSGSQDSLQQSCDLSYSHIEKAGNNVINENYVTGNDTKQVMPEHVKFITNGNGGWSYTNTKNALQNGANYTKDISGKIDSFNVNTSGKTTQEVPPNNASFQQTFGQQKEVDSRPKVQARAWVTPSPAEQDQNKSNNMYGAQNLVTKSSPYSSRSTLTSVTTTTAYSKGNSVQSPQQYTQSNGWNDEPKKKSVRFSEFNDYAEHYGHDEREDDTMDEGILFTRRIRVPSTMTQKPPRPVSAKTTTQTAKVDPQIRSSTSCQCWNSKNNAYISAAAQINNSSTSCCSYNYPQFRINL
ncbi:hypothetical protein KUTeg_007707 [Tegillarca granosa]|uniref:Uncharacterized protein n=1 Tax=Tegillarca granosa TaxID=220873 RepID=A0ABQ9FGA9_TEGGR|nr:hypothetical protein KUTeg_007707 [Tegillarca granosa]